MFGPVTFLSSLRWWLISRNNWYDTILISSMMTSFHVSHRSNSFEPFSGLKFPVLQCSTIRHNARCRMDPCMLYAAIPVGARNMTELPDWMDKPWQEAPGLLISERIFLFLLHQNKINGRRCGLTWDWPIKYTCSSQQCFLMIPLAANCSLFHFDIFVCYWLSVIQHDCNMQTSSAISSSIATSWLISKLSSRRT